MRWTTDQRLAIETRNSNLLLAAAAGSGKTTVLVERVLSLIDEEHNIDDMLIVTFTRAAAADMREKLTRVLSERAEQTLHHRDQLDRLERASVSTIHSFCMDLLRNHFEAADVDPDFRVLDSVELAQLEARALTDAMETVYARGGDDLAALCFGRDAKTVAEMAKALYHFALERPEPWEFLEESVHVMEAGGEIWLNELLAASKRRLTEALALAEQAFMLCESPDGPKTYLKTIAGDIDVLSGLLNAPSYEALGSSLQRIKFAPIARRTKSADYTPAQDELAEQIKDIRKSVKTLVEKEIKRFVAPEHAKQDLLQSVPALRALIACVKEMDLRLEALKEERSAYCFNDLEHRALLALRKEHVVSALRARYEFVFIDEYQDVSDVQEAIIRRVCRGDNLFMVGDVKQSIYRFRQAEPSLFIEKYRLFSHGEGGVLVALKQNFRSRGAILRFVNAVFERLMYGGDSEIEYDDAAHLRLGAGYEDEDPPIELNLLVKNGARGEESEEREDLEGSDEPDASEGEELSQVELNDTEKEGMVIVQRIRKLLEEQFYDAKAGEGAEKYRPIQPRDIVILTRTRAGIRHLEGMLKAAGIPCYADTSENYFEVLEVRVMLALLQVIENRRRDVELLAVLRSPVMGLTSTQLATIRAHSPEGSFRDAELAYMQLETALAGKLRALEAKLERWRMLSHVLPLSQLLDLVYRETGYPAYVSALPGGRQRKANLDMLIQQASGFENTQTGGLTAFLNYIRDVKRGGDDFGTAHTLGEGDNVVRLMTIHKSKGLEFPVVIAANLGKAFSHSAQRTELTAHRALGVGLKLNDPRLSSTRDTIARRAILERKQQEDLNEEMRVLYVLLTRPQHLLILVGSIANLEKNLLRWEIGGRMHLRPRSYLDAMMPTLIAMPGAEALRRGGYGVDGLPGVLVNLIPTETVAGPAEESRSEAIQELVQKIDEIMERPQDFPGHPIRWRYPFEEEVLMPMKLTASGLVREWTGPEALPPLANRPRFLSEEGMTAAERGTLTHAALQALTLEPLRGLRGEALDREINRQLDDLRARGVLFASVETRLIARFLRGDTGVRLLASERVEREWPFNLRMTAREALSQDGDALLLVQGVVDCCFMENGKWVLLDYKTDRAENVEELCEYYRPQLELYAKALERITGVEVAEKMLVLLRAGLELRL